MAQALLRNDEEIRNVIIEQLYWDDRLRSSNIKIKVTGGAAHLSGTVPSYAAWRAAGQYALLTAGICIVDNRLQIRYKKGLPSPPDEQLRQHISDAFSWNAHIDAARLTVTARSGCIVLEGTVEAYWQKMKATEIAAEMLGVTGIENEIKVIPIDRMDDEYLREDVAAALERFAGSSAVSVTVENGVVTLSGPVANPALYRAMVDAATHAAGVVDLRVRLALI